MLQLNDYRIDLTPIGNGAQAKIVEAQHVVSGERVAVKIYSLKQECDHLSFENEARLLHQCMNIPRVLRVRSCFSHSHFGFLVMDLYPTDLLSVVMESGGLGEAHAITLFRQIAETVHRCHQRNIAHLDLKPDNILCDQHNCPTLCDFNSAFQFDDPTGLYDIGRRGTMEYCAPEVKFDPAYNPICADIWSLGILLHVMAVGYFPHGRKPQDLESYSQGNIDLSFIRKQVSPGFVDLLQKILNPRPFDRPSIPEILSHHVFTPQTEFRQSLEAVTYKISGRFPSIFSRRRTREGL